MRTKILLLGFIFIFSGQVLQSQILKKLKKKVENTTEKVLLKKTEEQTEKTVEGTIDDATNPNSDKNPSSKPVNQGSQASNADANKAKLINTDAKRSFYTHDVIVKTSDSKGKGSDYYFDSDEIAARGIAPNSETPIFIDSEAYQYGYNESEGRWEKTGLMKSDAMSFMMPMVSMGMLKLPPKPMLDASEKFKNQGMSLNTFQIVEWAFIYEPDHFRTEDYEETTGPCPTGGDCPKFLYKDPEYQGSWVLFDKQGRLSEIYANVNTQQAQGDGTYKFEYAPVSVSIPSAVEVKMPFQDLYMKGLDVDPNNSNPNGLPSGTNVSSAGDPGNIPGSDPNEKIAKIDPDNPLSFPGVTAVISVSNRKVTMDMNTETMALRMNLHDPKMEPVYFDRNNYIYMKNKDGCMKAKLDLNMAFAQMEEGLKGKTLPSGMDMKKIREDYYRNNFGMQLAPENVPPIAGWAYVYTPEFLEGQENIEKTTVSCDQGTCLKFTMTQGKEKGSYVLFDEYKRLKKIYSSESKDASITYTYPDHSSLKIPDFKNCQEVDLNQDVIGKMMGQN